MRKLSVNSNSYLRNRAFYSLKVAFISHYPELYGANRSLLGLIEFLKEEGSVEPHIVCAREGDFPAKARSLSIPSRIIPFDTWMSERVYMGGPHHKITQHLRFRKRAKERAKANTYLLSELEACLKNWGCDLVYSNSSVFGIGHQVAERMDIPHIWHIREFGRQDYGLYLDQGKRNFKRALNKAARLVTISKAVEHYLRSVCGRNDIKVIYNGVLRKNEFATKQEQCPWPESELFTFAMVGLIHPGKGHMDAVNALSELDASKSFRLLIAGSGKAEKIKQRITELGIEDKVEFMGYVEDPFEVYRKCNALLMCSRKEGMGRVTAEAMAVGRPVIGYASGGTVELIKSGVNGLLYDGGVANLASCMKKLMNDPEDAKAMGQRAAEIAEQRFNYDDHGKKVLDVILSVSLGNKE